MTHDENECFDNIRQGTAYARKIARDTAECLDMAIQLAAQETTRLPADLRRSVVFELPVTVAEALLRVVHLRAHGKEIPVPTAPLDTFLVAALEIGLRRAGERDA